ncbi:MAG: hypothetical protein KBT06_10760 [Prevotellaceae bacterium]|nr:hypothetical protein [Candidatus Colivivens equi]
MISKSTIRVTMYMLFAGVVSGVFYKKGYSKGIEKLRELEEENELLKKTNESLIVTIEDLEELLNHQETLCSYDWMHESEAQVQGEPEPEPEPEKENDVSNTTNEDYIPEEPKEPEDWDDEPYPGQDDENPFPHYVEKPPIEDYMTKYRAVRKTEFGGGTVQNVFDWAERPDEEFYDDPRDYMMNEHGDPIGYDTYDEED